MELTKINAGTMYPVECGQAVAQLYLTDIFKSRLEKAQVAVITDREVSGYYISDFVRQFERIGIKPLVIVIDGSQAAKSFDVVRAVFERLTDIEFSHSDILFALGGGGVIDVAAFVAATFRKGIEYIQIPTSLLAMIDSSTARDAFLNFQSHKNQIGVTYSPIHVIIDTDYLRTLPPRFQANGIAQVIQYGLLENPDLLANLDSPNVDMFSLVDTCIQTRKILLDANPGYLAFGQEIAEAIEGHFRFLKYTHGEAMALGMIALFQSDALRKLYVKNGLPTTVTGVTKDTLLKRITKNYENRTEPVPIVRLESEGKPFIDMIPVEEAALVFDKLLSGICQ
ncbi:MAG: iron-containing alcohol dehydrogenase [Eubacteriales bacterium]